MKTALILGLAAMLGAPDAAYRREIERWRQQREANLRSEDGWLTVAGLFWLKQGGNRIGTSAGDEVALPSGAAPPRVGTLLLEGGHARLHADAGVLLNGKPVDAAELHPNTDVLSVGRLKLLFIERGGRYAIRMKDPQSEMRRKFTGERWFPVDERWRLKARFVSYPVPKKVFFDTVVGVKEEMESPGYVAFTVAAKEYRLEPVREGDGLFFVFRDATSGKTTYGASRFLNTPAPRDGAVVLDFNRAVNPPCAFTPYATCPLPPRQNRLALAITAGEMNYPGPH